MAVLNTFPLSHMLQCMHPTPLQLWHAGDIHAVGTHQLRSWLLYLQSMAWVGQKLVLCTSLRYILLHPAQGISTQLFALAEEAPSPTLVQSIPSAKLVVLLMVSTWLCRSPCTSANALCLHCCQWISCCSLALWLGTAARANALSMGPLCVGSLQVPLHCIPAEVDKAM